MIKTVFQLSIALLLSVALHGLLFWIIAPWSNQQPLDQSSPTRKVPITVTIPEQGNFSLDFSKKTNTREPFNSRKDVDENGRVPLNKPPETLNRPASAPVAKSQTDLSPSSGLKKPKLSGQKEAQRTSDSQEYLQTDFSDTPPQPELESGVTNPGETGWQGNRMDQPKVDVIGKIENEYRLDLLNELAKHKKYPDSARRRGQEGQAVIQFSVLKDGNITNLSIKESSGWRVLDHAALQSLERMGRFKPLPKELDRERWDLHVSIRFALE